VEALLLSSWRGKTGETLDEEFRRGEEVRAAVGRVCKGRRQRSGFVCNVLGGRPVTMLSLGGVGVLEVEPVERTMRGLAGRPDDGSIAERSVSRRATR
jgi:hypothetical protein